MHAAHEALAAFAAGAQPAAGADTDAAALQRALMTWQHPDTPLPAPGVCALGNAGAAGQAVLGARRGAWQEAFRSLFLALRAGRCAAFYVATAQARCLPGSQCELSATELPGLGALNGSDMSHAVHLRSQPQAHKLYISPCCPARGSARVCLVTR